MIRKINESFNEAETCFNVAGSFPIISVPSGVIRAHIGTAQTVVGAALAVIGSMGHVFSDRDDKRWLKLVKLGVEHLIQGALNFIRGVGETLLGIYTLGIGNLILMAVQYHSKEGFEPILKYGFITEDKRLIFA